MTESGSPPSNSARVPAPDWDAIARYLAGESSADEASRVARWLETHPTDKYLIDQLNASAVTGVLTDVDVDAALRRVHGRMHEERSSSSHLTLQRGGAARRPRRLAAAVMAAIAAGIVAAVVTINRPSAPSSPTGNPRVYSTGTGKRDSVRLADGSRVILGPESRLTVPADFGRSSRAVSLDGDAYFDVQHDAGKPFSVRVANALVEDVGTTFTVETDPGDTTTVSVLSGVVRLRPATARATGGATLSAGDRGTLTSDGRVHAQQHVVVADDSAWTTGKLVFRDASLVRVAGELRRWYGLRLGIADSSLVRRTVNTTFMADEPVDSVLNVLSLMLGARVERAGGSDSATIHLDRGSNTVR
jgi:transmembrane sensor